MCQFSWETTILNVYAPNDRAPKYETKTDRTERKKKRKRKNSLLYWNIAKHFCN